MLLFAHQDWFFLPFDPIATCTPLSSIPRCLLRKNITFTCSHRLFTLRDFSIIKHKINLVTFRTEADHTEHANTVN